MIRHSYSSGSSYCSNTCSHFTGNSRVDFTYSIKKVDLALIMNTPNCFSISDVNTSSFMTTSFAIMATNAS